MSSNFFVRLLNAVYQSLPDSFIQNAGLIEKESFGLFEDYLNYLNWIIPFVIVSRIMAVWLPCILTYYIVSSSRTVIKKLFRMFVDRL